MKHGTTFLRNFPLLKQLWHCFSSKKCQNLFLNNFVLQKNICKKQKQTIDCTMNFHPLKIDIRKGQGATLLATRSRKLSKSESKDSQYFNSTPPHLSFSFEKLIYCNEILHGEKTNHLHRFVFFIPFIATPRFSHNHT